MNLSSFNRGMDDVYFCRPLDEDPDEDYLEGVRYANDIERDADRREEEEKLYKEEMDRIYKEDQEIENDGEK